MTGDEQLMVQLNAVEKKMLGSIRDHLAVHSYRPTQESALSLAVGMLYYRLINEGKITEGESRQSDRRSSGGDKPRPT